ncbi:hypothetical protein [Streptomyces sp. B3I8]|uniref:hypothetical protein n=1 Tax=Streptomyces sp. B3I8 TaxID=3042303 RepID=UPI0027D82656|nr:hypothetical protein [Streptomyces sp. B3I8]
MEELIGTLALVGRSLTALYSLVIGTLAIRTPWPRGKDTGNIPVGAASWARGAGRR